jgi:hypothetical protein
MRIRIISLFVVAVLVLLLGAPAWADLLYDNGPINGTFAWLINDGFWISNSFSLSSASNLGGAQIGLWVTPGDVATSVDWSIGTGANDSTFGHATAALTNTFVTSINVYGYDYDIYESTFPLNVALGPGTYWLTFQNAVGGDEVAWDENDGPSQAWQSFYGDLSQFYLQHYNETRTGSESFQIYGPTSAVPEPTTMILLGSGLIGVLGLRRKFRK